MLRLTICSILMLIITMNISAQETPIEITSDNVTQLELLGYLGRGTLGEITWTADGQWLAVSTSMGIELYDYDNMDVPPIYADVPDDFTLLTTHPIENWLVGHNSNFDIIYWDIATHQITAIIQLTEDIDNIQKLVFDDIGTRFAIVESHHSGENTRAGRAYIWDVSNRTSPTLLEFVFHTTESSDVFFVDDYVFILGWDGQILVNLVNSNENQYSHIFGIRNSTINSQKSIITSFAENSIILRNTRNKLSGQPSLMDVDYTRVEIRATDVAYSADGQFLITTREAQDGIDIYDGKTFNSLWEFTGFSPIFSGMLNTEHFTPHPIDNFLVFRDQNSLYTYRFDEQPPQLLMDDYNITPAVVSIDGTRLISQDGHGRISLWDIPSMEKQMSLYMDNISGKFFTPNNHLLIVSEQGKRLTLWDIATQQILNEVQLDIPYTSTPPHVSPDGQWLAIGNLLFDTSTLEWRKDFDDALYQQYIHGGEIQGFTPDGAYIFYQFNNHTMFILRTRDGEIVGVIEEENILWKSYFCEQKPKDRYDIPIMLDFSSHLTEYPANNYWIVVPRITFGSLSLDCTQLIYTGDVIKVYDALIDEVINTIEWEDNKKYVNTWLHNETLAIVTEKNQTLFIDAQTGELVYELPISFQTWLNPNPNANPRHYLFQENEVWGIRDISVMSN